MFLLQAVSLCRNGILVETASWSISAKSSHVCISPFRCILCSGPLVVRNLPAMLLRLSSVTRCCIGWIVFVCGDRPNVPVPRRLRKSGMRGKLSTLPSLPTLASQGPNSPLSWAHSAATQTCLVFKSKTALDSLWPARATLAKLRLKTHSYSCLTQKAEPYLPMTTRQTMILAEPIRAPSALHSDYREIRFPTDSIFWRFLAITTTRSILRATCCFPIPEPTATSW